jgi:hypothetical protein
MTKLPNIPTAAALRLTGTKSEIELVLAVLRGKDFFWKTNGKFYPQRGEENQYAYYLNWGQQSRHQHPGKHNLDLGMQF